MGRTRRPDHRGRFLRRQRRWKAKHPVPVEPHHCHNFCEELAVAAWAKHELWKVAHSSNGSVEFVFDQRGAMHRIQTVRLYPAGVQYRSWELRSPIPRCWRRRLWRSWLTSSQIRLAMTSFATLAVLRLRCFSFASGASHTPPCSATMSDLLNVQRTLPRTHAQIIPGDLFS